MGARGPAPTPDNLRLLKGNGKDRDPAGRKVRRQPKTVPAAPAAPDGLEGSAKWMWEYVTPELVRMGIMGRVDLGTLEAYCKAYDDMHNHPGGRGFSTVAMTMANLGSKLGLDPASRLRMTLPEAPDGEEGDVFGTG
jgi:phage terminase small subunit